MGALEPPLELWYARTSTPSGADWSLLDQVILGGQIGQCTSFAYIQERSTQGVELTDGSIEG